jgi:hypothetical protein
MEHEKMNDIAANRPAAGRIMRGALAVIAAPFVLAAAFWLAIFISSLIFPPQSEIQAGTAAELLTPEDNARLALNARFPGAAFRNVRAASDNLHVCGQINLPSTPATDWRVFVIDPTTQAVRMSPRDNQTREGKAFFAHWSATC